MFRKLYIDKKLLKECNSNGNLLLAIALMLCIKRDYVNSKVYDCTISKLMQICHGNHHSIRIALDTAIEKGYAEETTYTRKKKVHKNLDAKKLRSLDEPIYAQFCVTVNQTGHKIIYFKSNEKGIDSKKTAQASSGPQTFRQICNMLKKSVTAKEIRRYIKYINAHAAKVAKSNAESMRYGANGPIFNFEITPFITGISYKRISENLKSKGMSRWKVMKLIRELQKDHLIEIQHNTKPIANFTPGLFYDENERNMLVDALLEHKMDWEDVRTGSNVSAREHAYKGKNESACTYFRRFGNSYRFTGSILVYNRHRLKANQSNGNS